MHDRDKGAIMYYLTARSDEKTLSDGDLKNILILHKHGASAREIGEVFDIQEIEVAEVLRHVLRQGFDHKDPTVADLRRPWTHGDVFTARTLRGQGVAPEKIAHILRLPLQEVYLRTD